jgi:osmotically-inducible protein OsmY
MTSNKRLNTIFKVCRCSSYLGLALLWGAALTVGILFSADLQAQNPSGTYSYKSSELDSVHTSSVHNYASEADRANDALLITEVKKALDDDGVTAYRAVVVDCDHGTIVLNGVVGSSAAAQHAAAVARDVDGVVAVKNELRWPRSGWKPGGNS